MTDPQTEARAIARKWHSESADINTLAEYIATALAAKDANIKMLGEQMVTERLHGYELLERAERQWAGWVKEEALRKAAEAQLAESNKAKEIAAALQDSAYLAGAKEGWNAAHADDPNDAFDKLVKSRKGYLKPITAARRGREAALRGEAS